MVVEHWLDLKKNITIASWSFLPSDGPYVIILKIMFYSPHFEVYTDFDPLTYIKISFKVNATGQRWLNELVSFNFPIHYKPGAKKNM